MTYVIDRHLVVWDAQVVAILAARSRQTNGHWLLRDGSVVKTRTRAKTLINRLGQTRRCKGLLWLNDRRKRRA